MLNIEANKASNLWPAALTASILRLLLGITFILALPVFGYDNPRHNAGYIFADAFERDQQAWKMARTPNISIMEAFSGNFPGDQYGGMLALSAFIYRYLSADFHRPFLILLLTALSAGFGSLVTGLACRNLWGDRVATLSAWIFALYPEAVMLGSSQMREGFVFTAIALAFYSLTITGRKRILAGLASLFMLLFFQPPAALIAFVVFTGWWLLEPNRSVIKHLSVKTLGIYGGIFTIAMFLVYLAWSRLPSLQGVPFFQILFKWLINNFNVQSYWVIRKSGWLQLVIEGIGNNWKLPVILIYGIAQPALPGALVDSGALIMRLVAVYRSLGWYMMAPMLLYGLLPAWRQEKVNRRWQLIWMWVVLWAWTIIAALNAGGDQWDNPRYRAMLLVWQAAFAAWVWVNAGRDAWLRRLLLIEVAFLVVFTLLYLLKATPLPIPFNHLTAAGLVVVFAIAVLVYGFYKDRH